MKYGVLLAYSELYSCKNYLSVESEHKMAYKSVVVVVVFKTFRMLCNLHPGEDGHVVVEVDHSRVS